MRTRVTVVENRLQRVFALMDIEPLPRIRIR